MRFKNFTDRTQARQGVLRSECDVGLFEEINEQGDARTILIYDGEISDQIVDFVTDSLAQRFNFTSFFVGSKSFMTTQVTTSPEEILTTCG